MKLLLLNPPDINKEKFTREGRCTQHSGIWTTLWPPLSLVYIGTLLKSNGHTVKVLDCPAERIEIEALEEIIRSYVPDVLLWSTGTPTIESDLSLAAGFKSVLPSIKTAVFGTHVSALDKECMTRAPLLDTIIRNEPEYTALEWIQHLAASESIDTVRGITYRNNSGEIVQNPSREFIGDLDTLPFPDWSLIRHTAYILPFKGEPFLTIAPLRGCPYSCTFCTSQTYYGNKVRLRSPLSLIEEMKYLIGTFGVSNFFFWAETFTVNRSFVIELCSALKKSGLKISWVCNARVDTVDDEMLRVMREAGCWMVSYGIESANRSVLKEMKKNITPAQVERAVDIAKKHGMIVSGHVILGLPGETVDSAHATVDFMARLNIEFAQFYCAVPFPGAALYRIAVEEGYIGEPAFECFRQERAVMSLPTISAREVETIRRTAIRTFYLRPSRILKILKLMRGKALWRSMPGIMKFIKGLFF